MLPFAVYFTYEYRWMLTLGCIWFILVWDSLMSTAKLERFVNKNTFWQQRGNNFLLLATDVDNVIYNYILWDARFTRYILMWQIWDQRRKITPLPKGILATSRNKSRSWSAQLGVGCDKGSNRCRPRTGSTAKDVALLMNLELGNKISEFWEGTGRLFSMLYPPQC